MSRFCPLKCIEFEVFFFLHFAETVANRGPTEGSFAIAISFDFWEAKRLSGTNELSSVIVARHAYMCLQTSDKRRKEIDEEEAGRIEISVIVTKQRKIDNGESSE